MSLTIEVTLMALSVALGTALQVSGVGGPIATGIAWLAVVSLGVFLAVQRARGGPALHANVARKARRLGNDLVHFSRGRDASFPRGERTWRYWPRGSRSRREHEADTMSLFRERFGEILLQIVDDLRGAGVIGFVEAQRLVTPASPEGIERIGQRLIELGSQTATG